MQAAFQGLGTCAGVCCWLGVWRLLDYSVAVKVGVANRLQFSKPINRSQRDIGSNCQAPDVLFTLSWNQWLETFKYSFHVEINVLKNVIFCCHYYDGGTLVRYRLRSLTHFQRQKQHETTWCNASERDSLFKWAGKPGIPSVDVRRWWEFLFCGFAFHAYHRPSNRLRVARIPAKPACFLKCVSEHHCCRSLWIVSMSSKRSPTWDYFSLTDDKKKTECVLCKSKLKYTGGTSAMKNHLWLVHKKSVDETEKTGQSLMRQSSLVAWQKSRQALGQGKYEAINRKLAAMCARDLRPIGIVDSVGFREFVRELNPQYQVPSRKTVTK